MEKKAKLLFILLIFLSFNSFGKNIITIAVGSTEESFYPVGILLGNTIQEAGYNCSIQTSRDSVENLELLLNKKVEIAFLTADIGEMSYEGRGIFKNNFNSKNLRSITGLHFSYVQIIAKEESRINSFKDLKGKRVGIGIYNSAVDLNMRLIYNAFNMTYKDTHTFFFSVGELMERLKKGTIDAMVVINNIPNKAIKDLKSEEKIKMIPLEGEEVEKLISKYPFFSKKIIPKKIYNTKKNIDTIAIREVLVTREDLPEEDIYNITKAIFDNLKSMKEQNEIIKNRIFLLNSRSNIRIPFHKGAIKYYEEQKL